MVVIEFVIVVFVKLVLNGEVLGGSGLLKFWFVKLVFFVYDKNVKLKEIVVIGFIFVYFYFDLFIVFNFIFGLLIEE